MGWRCAEDLDVDVDGGVVLYLQLVVVEDPCMAAVVLEQDLVQVVGQCKLQLLPDKRSPVVNVVVL